MNIAYNDRDLSWLDFNERVLECANDGNIALLDRVNFLAISASNMDEFFQVRMSHLKKSLSDNTLIARDERTLIIENILSRVGNFYIQQHETFVRLTSELAANNIIFGDIEDLNQSQKNWITGYFDDNIYPVLTPLAVDPAHPFPWISSKSVNLAIILREQKTEIQRFARIKVPTNLERLVQLPGSTTFIPLEKLIISQWDHQNFQNISFETVEIDGQSSSMFSEVDEKIERDYFSIDDFRSLIMDAVKSNNIERQKLSNL